jgi:hypothetical protein
LLGSPKYVQVLNEEILINIDLPRQGVSFLKLEWR